MSSESRGWQPFEPGHDALPTSLSDEGDAGETVVLVAADGDRLEAWSREAAASVARSWAVRAERLLLMDLDLESPGLHRLLGVENREGAADIFLFGSSIQRVARAVDDGSFYFAPAGTAAAETDVVLRHHRWQRLVRGFREAGARLLLYLPLDAPGSEAVLERADRIVLLGAPEAIDDDRLAGMDARIAAALAPPTGEGTGRRGTDAEEPEATRAEPSQDGALDDGGSVSVGEEVMDVAELAPDEPVVDIAELAPDEEIVDIADLAPDEETVRSAEPEGARVQDTGPPGEAQSEGRVVDVAELAPDEPVVDIADLAPDEEVVDIADLAPDAAPGPAGAEATEPGVIEPDPGSGEETGAAPEPDRSASAEEALGEAVEEAASDARPVAPAEDSEPGTDDGGEREAVEPGPARGGEPADEREPGEADEGEFGDFDLTTLDELSEGLEPREDETEDRAGFDRDESPVDAAEPEDPPGFDLDDAPVEAEEPEGPSGEEPDVSEDREEEFRPDAPGVAGEAGRDAAGSEAAGGEFGGDLVTGPDFGPGGAADEGEGGAVESPEAEAGPGPVAAKNNDPGPADPGIREGRDAPRTVEEPQPGGEDDAGASPERAAARRAERRDEGPPGWRAPSRRPLRLALLLLVVMAGALSAHWLGVVRLPGVDRALATVFGPANTGRAPPVETTEPAPTTPVMGYSLVVDGYRDFGSASEVAAALRDRMPNHVFVVAPVQAGGDVSHRILAGPARTAEEAGALREPLAAVLSREDPEGWTVRATPLAFLLRETGNLQNALDRVGQLSEQGVPAYVLQVSYPEDGVRYRVYAGAYESPEEARAMRGILARAGVTGVTFTERRGRIPE